MEHESEATGPQEVLPWPSRHYARHQAWYFSSYPSSRLDGTAWLRPHQPPSHAPPIMMLHHRGTADGCVTMPDWCLTSDDTKRERYRKCKIKILSTSYGAPSCAPVTRHRQRTGVCSQTRDRQSGAAKNSLRKPHTPPYTCHVYLAHMFSKYQLVSRHAWVTRTRLGTRLSSVSYTWAPPELCLIGTGLPRARGAIHGTRAIHGMGHALHVHVTPTAILQRCGGERVVTP